MRGEAMRRETRLGLKLALTILVAAAALLKAGENALRAALPPS